MGALRLLLRLIFGLIKFIGLLLGTALLLVLIFWFFLDDIPMGPVPAALTEDTGKRYVDMHTHVAGIGEGDSGCFISESMRSNFRYYFYLYALGVTEQELKEEGDGLVVRRLSELVRDSRLVNKAVVLAMDGVIGPDGNLNREATQVYVPNEYLAQEVKKYDNLLFGASINPYRPDALNRLIEAKKAGAVLVKWLPAIMQIDPADERLIPFYLALVELDLPLLTHVGAERSFAHASHELGDPRKLELPLKLGVTVIAAHVATTGSSEGESNFERILPMFAQYPNLYTDISSLTQINKLGYLAKALTQEGLSERMVYGSDWPLQFFPLVSPWYHFQHLSPAEMRYIFKQKNSLDRDVLTKRAFGTPNTVFEASEKLLLSRKPLEQIVAERTGGRPTETDAPQDEAP